MKSGLTMIELARRAGVPRTTLRFYERRGLLPPPRRTEGNYRVYDPAVAVRVRFTKRAQELGFTLEEIGVFLRAADGPTPDGATLATFGREKMREISEKIADLERMRAGIEARIGASDLTLPCPILASLGGTDAVAEAADNGPRDRRRRP